METAERYDAIVIGSGFAGAVTACRLAESGQRVLVLERGRRYQLDDFPVFPNPARGGGDGEGAPDFSRAFWKLGQGLWDVRDLGDAIVAQAAGYGGGSLVYANVHLRAPKEVFEDWPEEYRGDALEPYYDLAAYMLEVEPLPGQYEGLPKRSRFDAAAKGLGRRSFRPPLAVNFQRERTLLGVEQGVCDLRGDCCFGCGAGAKNTLDLNYLALAEERGAAVETLAEVVSIEERDGEGLDEDGHYVVHYRSHVYVEERSVVARWVFLCAGSVNTTELLLRSRAAGLLPAGGPEPGSRYFPNSDDVAVAFDCDELHETDRGPTITSGLLYDGAPEENDPSARWKLAFRQGVREPAPGSAVRGRCSGARGDLAVLPLLRAGDWRNSTASGELVLSSVCGTFREDEPLESDGHDFAYAASAARELRHWFLVEDGGMPEPLEPLLGVFRSPLWVRRNRFDERLAAEADGARSTRPLRSPRMAYAPLPFGSLPELASSLPRGALQGVPQLRNEVLRGSDWLPPQLADALARDREELLDDFAALGEGIVNDFLDRAAAGIEDEYRFEDLLKRLDLAGLEVSGVGGLELGRRILRLAVQIAFGSQARLARDVAELVLNRALPGQRGLSRRLFEAVRWLLDYRLSDGRTGVLLVMGRDALPGTLSLGVGAIPEPGSAVRSARSDAEGIVIGASEPGGWARGHGGTLVLAMRRGRFSEGDCLLGGTTSLGVARSQPEDIGATASFGTDPESFVGSALAGLRLCVLRVEVPRVPQGRMSPRIEHASLRVRLPDALETPERATQERLLRDIAARWGGELRTNPVSSLFGRRISVHSQGGCPMPSVTDASGLAAGCRGLYVMDAAAFPSPVGVNPSATIAAVAEYKVKRFIRAHVDPRWEPWRFEDARSWASGRRESLDPLSSETTPSPPPASRPVGIEFDEVMRGQIALGEGSLPISTCMHATISDLGRFLDLHRSGQPQMIQLTGSVAIGSEPRHFELGDKSHLRLFRTVGDGTGAEWRTMEYALWWEDAEGDGGRHAYRLEGQKNLRDESGTFDLWEDSTTLIFKVLRDGQIVWPRGILRTPAHEFFEMQLPSFRATNTTDPARQSWALAAFGKFFFGHLVDTYVPELDRVIDVVKTFSGLPRD